MVEFLEKAANPGPYVKGCVKRVCKEYARYKNPKTEKNKDKDGKVGQVNSLNFEFPTFWRGVLLKLSL